MDMATRGWRCSDRWEWQIKSVKRLETVNNHLSFDPGSVARSAQKNAVLFYERGPRCESANQCPPSSNVFNGVRRRL